MTPEEIRELNKHLEAAAAILFKNTPSNKLQDFESLELALRDQLREHVHPIFGHFFTRQHRDDRRKKASSTDLCRDSECERAAGTKAPAQAQKTIESLD